MNRGGRASYIVPHNADKGLALEDEGGYVLKGRKCSSLKNIIKK